MFTPKTISFLKALKRNNNREWFRPRKDQYETHVRGPMSAVVERLAQDFGSFAPELIASPKQSLFRIYRDTRFSDNKKPLKTHAAAIFRTRQLPKPQGAGLGLGGRRHVAPRTFRARAAPRAHRRDVAGGT